MPANYWDDRWLNDNTSWDMHQVSPPLQAYLSQLTDKTISILIPGCGNAYEAGWLLDNGFTSVTLIDISPTLTGRLREKFPGIPVITGDFFEHSGQYDLILEQTFFCSLDPALREKYVEHTHTLLRPGGKLIGLLFDRNFVGGPPFGGHKDEYQTLLEKNLK
ncbi:methyltransferase domain-containing protein [Puia sp. P3]|uniref:methyltransferase domain-containing protein n=1 Tax=Puia sp. P3 TaxID=3423952 RepID=UPI003D67F267